MIWHEIVCWLLKIYKDLKRFAAQEQRIVLVLMFRCVEQFYVPSMQKQSKTGKNPEINRNSFIIWWHNSKKYGSVWYLLSCTKNYVNFFLDKSSKCGLPGNYTDGICNNENNNEACYFDGGDCCLETTIQAGKENYFSNFSCMFLNPNSFFQFEL